MNTSASSKEHVCQAFVYIKAKENLTTVDYAKLLMTSRPSLHNILTGKSYPSLDLVIKLFNKFPELSKDWTFTGEGIPVGDLDLAHQADKTIAELKSMNEKKDDLIRLLQDTVDAFKLRFKQLQE